MTITTTGLTRAAGLCAAAAGLIYIAVQIKHPAMEVASVATTEWVVRNSAKVVMAALALIGIGGMYLRQVRQMGVLGLLGYLLFSVGFLTMGTVAAIGGYALPGLVDIAPGYVNDVVIAADGGTPVGDIGGMQIVFAVSGAGYILGGLVFGVALVRARVLTRWAAALLAVGTLATASLAVLPEEFNRPMAVPVGLALIGLGVSLWRNPRDASPEVDLTATRGELAAV